MIKSIEFGNQEFKDKAELFKALKENKELIISNKKANKTKSTPIEGVYQNIDTITKGFNDAEEGYIYPVINTIGYMDSHNDVHIKGIWDKSSKDKQHKIYYTTDHKLEIDKIIAYPEDVEICVYDTTFKNLGYNKEGDTEVLAYKISTDVFSYANTQAVKHINAKKHFQHSVKMEYVKMSLCINSEDKEFKSEKKEFDKYISQVANHEKAYDLGFFWAQTEAKIVQEGSMLPFGSNDITPMNYGNEPSQDTQKAEKEPSNDIQKARDEIYLMFGK